MEEDSKSYRREQVLKLAGVETLPAEPPPWMLRWQEQFRRDEAARREKQAATRARNTVNQRASRERKRIEREAEIAATLRALEMPPAESLDQRTIDREMRAFRDWLLIDGARQRQFKAQRRSYFVSRLVLLQARRELGGIDPEPSEFAARLTIALREPFDRHQGRQRLKQLLSLEAQGGPWWSVTEAA